MSVICGVATSDALYMGADDMVRIGQLRMHRVRKLHVVAPSAKSSYPTWVLGVAGDMRALGELSAVAREECPDIHSFMRTVRLHVSDLKPARVEDPYGFEMLVGCAPVAGSDEPCRLWVVSNTLAFTEVSVGSVGAVGSGAQAALGAAHALKHADIDGYVASPSEVLRLSMRAASQVNAFCGSDYCGLRLASGKAPESLW